jgi:hypothetical protein
MKNTICFLVCSVLLTSCASKKLPVTDFLPLTEPIAFNGTYFNENGKLSNLFNLYGDITDFITIEYNLANSDTIQLSYYTENGLEHSYFKGKMKENFFEIYFRNKRIYIPILYMVEDIDRLRIGTANNSDLLIHHWEEASGMILIMAGGSGNDEYSYSDTKFDLSQCNFLVPFFKEDKWGFMDNTRKIEITPEYDFVRLFNNGIARVKLNGKWGLINEKGKAITEIKYDEIHRVEDDLLRVLQNNKIGYIDNSGKEIIHPEYDRLYLNKFNTISKTKKNNKYGYATIEGILFPPVFDKAADYFYCDVCFFQDIKNEVPYAKVKYKEESYIVTKEGFMYKYKCSWGKFTVFEESKIKASELYDDE